MKEYNPKWSEAPVHPYRIVIIGSSGVGQSNSLFNQMNQQSDIDEIY